MLRKTTKTIFVKNSCFLLLIIFCILYGSCRNEISTDPQSKRSNIVSEMYTKKNTPDKEENVNPENYNELLKTFDTSFFKPNDTLNKNCSTFMYQEYQQELRKNRYNNHLNSKDENYFLLH